RPGRRRFPAHAGPHEVLAWDLLRSRARQPLGAPLARPVRGVEARVVRLREFVPRGYVFTVVGIAVGVAGLVALGAMAERITRFIDGGDRFVLGQISVAGEGMGMGTGFTAGGLPSAVKIAALAAVPGGAGLQAHALMSPVWGSTMRAISGCAAILSSFRPSARAACGATTSTQERRWGGRTVRIPTPWRDASRRQ